MLFGSLLFRVPVIHPPIPKLPLHLDLPIQFCTNTLDCIAPERCECGFPFAMYCCEVPGSPEPVPIPIPIPLPG